MPSSPESLMWTQPPRSKVSSCPLSFKREDRQASVTCTKPMEEEEVVAAGGNGGAAGSNGSAAPAAAAGAVGCSGGFDLNRLLSPSCRCCMRRRQVR